MKFTTESPVVGSTGVPNVGLAAGSPAPVPAVVTPTYGPGGAAPGPYAPNINTTLLTGALPTGQLPANSTIVPYKGGAGQTGISIASAVVMGLVAILAMI